jgi:O-antigen ligase
MALTRRNLDWLCERGILALVVGMLLFAPLAFGAVDAWAFLVVQALAMGVLVLWAARLWLAPKAKLLWPPLAWVVLAFMIYAGARYFTADIEYVARLEVIQVLVFGALFFALINNLHGQDEIVVISGALIAVGTASACYAVAQFAQHSTRVWNELSPYIGRASGTYISPNDLAGLLAMLLPLALAYLLVGKMHIVTRVLLGYAVLAMAAGLVLTFSRGGWGAAGIGVVLLLVTLLGHRNHRWKAAAILALLLIVGGFVAPHYLSRTVTYMKRAAMTDETDRPASVDGSWASRLSIWKSATQMWLDHPWTGVGPAHFDYRFREYRSPYLQQRPDRVHNDYLNLLADWGIIGGAIVVAGMGMFVFWLKKTWPHVRRGETDFGRAQSNRFAFFLGGMGGLTALAAHSVIDFNLHVPANALVGVTLLALVTSNVRYVTERYWVGVKIPLKFAVTVILLAMTTTLAMQEQRRTGETLWLARAAKLPNFSPERAAALEKAFACEPNNFATAYAIGECYRTESLNGGEHYPELGQEALDWYARVIQLNPYDGYGYLRTGMCLDWLGHHGPKALADYSQAESLDPNGYFMVANIGWHYVQTGDYAAALEYFKRSLRLEYKQNLIAQNYLSICESRLAAQASGQPQLPGNY